MMGDELEMNYPGGHWTRHVVYAARSVNRPI